jgi:hypothetical protein
VTECAEGLCIVPIDSNGSFLKYEALYVKTPGGRPVSVQGDKDTNLLFVADGTAGLTIIDLASLGASRDDDRDGVDDRVLGTTDLDGGARAQKVAVFRDPVGGLVAAVAAGNAGVHLARVLLPQTLAAATSPATEASGCCCADDGNACTTEQCLNGICVHVPINSPTCCNGRAYDSTTQCCESGGPIAKCINDPTNFSAQCINDLSQCPDRSARLGSTFPMTTDGCGHPITLVPNALLNNPALCSGTAFGTGDPSSPLACDHHDFCYAQCYMPTSALADELDRKTCDDRFYSEMQNVCANLSPIQAALPSPNLLFPGITCYAACSQYAAAYYSIVRSTAGRSAYETSQRTSCQCCP